MKVTVELNSQQLELVERLLADGDLGPDAAAVIRHGLVEFCRQHPELVGGADGER
jgi:hypothetical protein